MLTIVEILMLLCALYIALIFSIDSIRTHRENKKEIELLERIINESVEG